MIYIITHRRDESLDQLPLSSLPFTQYSFNKCLFPNLPPPEGGVQDTRCSSANGANFLIYCRYMCDDDDNDAELPEIPSHHGIRRQSRGSTMESGTTLSPGCRHRSSSMASEAVVLFKFLKLVRMLHNNTK